MNRKKRGETQPIVDNDTERNRFKNWRVSGLSRCGWEALKAFYTTGVRDSKLNHLRPTKLYMNRVTETISILE